MTEVMAVAQVAKFTNNAVPIVNIMANRTAFRPFIYFNHQDVLLSTPKAVPFRRDVNTIETTAPICSAETAQNIVHHV